MLFLVTEQIFFKYPKAGEQMLLDFFVKETRVLTSGFAYNITLSLYCSIISLLQLIQYSTWKSFFCVVHYDTTPQTIMVLPASGSTTVKYKIIRQHSFVRINTSGSN